MGKKMTQHRFLIPPTPRIFTSVQSEDLRSFRKKHRLAHIVDEYNGQLRELYYLRNPKVKEGSPEGLRGEAILIEKYKTAGVWAYYPWTDILVHCLPENLHQEVRTARNQHLVTQDEQRVLSKGVVGIAGLSIGNSVALSLAYSGIANTMKLADPDILSLSNLNRIRAPLQYLGAKKVYIAAQQIYEINPYAQLTLYPEGINADNVEDFLVGTPGLSLVVDEMDDIKLKIFLRLAARAARLPLVMATDNGDNAIIDIERYDENPFIKPFDTLPQLKVTDIAQGISYGEALNLEVKEKVMLATKLVGAHNAVPRMQRSLMRVGEDLVSWPQLGIAATMGGATLAYVIKKIILGMRIKSGKTHVSLDTMFETDSPQLLTDELNDYINNPLLVTHKNTDIWRISEREYPKNGSIEDQLTFILHYGTMAPSTHNTQPWRFRIVGQTIFLLGDPTRALPVSDPTKRNYYISLGACLYNIRVALAHFGFDGTVTYFPGDDPHIVASILCTKNDRSNVRLELFSAIGNRFTDKLQYLPKQIPHSLRKSIEKASLDPNIDIRVITDEKTKNRIADWVADSTRHIMKRTPFRAELSNWMRHNYTQAFDGMPANTVGIGDIQSIAGPFLMKTVNLTTGNGDRRLVQTSPVLVILTLKKESPESWVKLGEVYEYILLTATAKNVHNATLTALVESPIASRLARIFLRLPGKPQAFFRLGYSKNPILRSPRIPVSMLLR